MAAAAAAGILPSAGPESPNSEWFYELQPPAELPVLDLSQSLKSRFLSRQAIDRIDLCIQQRKFIAIAGCTSNVSYLATLFAPRSIGQVTSILSLVTWIPIALLGFSLLRYDVVKLLVRTYDFWLLSCVNLSVFVVLGMLIGDARALVMIATWAGVQVNILVDANIRKMRSWILLAILAIVVYTVTWIAITFKLIDNQQAFRLVHYRYHELPAAAFVANGLTTIIAAFARNVYRRRSILWKQPPKTHIECASYRTNLQFYPLTSIPESRERIVGAQEQPEYIKPMKYVQQIGLIDARNTLLCRRLLAKLSRAASCCISAANARRLFSWLGILAMLFSAGSALYSLKQDRFHNPVEEACHVFVFTMTLVYCGICSLHYHRILLLALVTSFDFLFLSTQVTTVHVCTRVFFNWEFDGTVTALTFWIWTHWFLCLDALPPVMKRKLGITKGFAIAVLLFLTSSSVMLLYLLVFTHMGSSDIYDHVVLEMTLFGHHDVRIQLASLFFNCFATACALTTRLIWRVATLHSDVLLVLDGIVEYENYLVGARVHVSRRFGSLSHERKQSRTRKPVTPQAAGSPTILALPQIAE